MKSRVHFSSMEVSSLLGVPFINLHKAIESRRLSPPQKCGRSYIWTRRNIEAAARLFCPDNDVFGTGETIISNREIQNATIT